MENDEEICELTRKKLKLQKDSRKGIEFADVSSRLGYLYFQKGYYEKALEEYDEALKKYKNDSVNLDCANIHRFIGETLCRLGNDLKRAKKEYDIYHSITVKLNDLVEIQRSNITLGNYYMNLTEGVGKHERIENLNKAYSHYLKAYDLMDDIEEKGLVDKREFALMKTRICLNCAFVLDEKNDEVMSNEYLKTAINLAESNNFHEDLIRCYYIKCDRSKKTNRLADCIKIADQIVTVTLKTKDFLQQSNDLLYVAEIYLNLGGFDRAKELLKKAYKLRKKCHISKTIKKKLKNIIKIQKLKPVIIKLEANYEENLIKLSQLYEQLADSYCAVDCFKIGVDCYKKQLHYAKLSNTSNNELSLIYSSIAQTYQDLDDYNNALDFYKLELNSLDDENKNYESMCKSLINIAYIKEKLKAEFTEIKCIYEKAFEKAKLAKNLALQVKTLKLLYDTEVLYHVRFTDTSEKLNEMKNLLKNSNEKIEESENESETSTDTTSSSISLSSESEDEETNLQSNSNTKSSSKLLKRNLRGETQLHIACIKGNLSLAKKLIEDGHPVHVRDNFRWTPLHEACNYGHFEIVKILLKNGARCNDQDGPITPLHDAAQNGHFLVVEALLEAGSTAYVFTDEGYTPLDFLHKYKIDNEKSMSGEELVLYQKLYAIMYKQITEKNRSYTVKSIINTDDALQIDTDENSNPEKPTTNKRYDFKNSKRSDSNKTTLAQNNSNSKSNAVDEYKNVIFNVGSKTVHNKNDAKSSRKNKVAIITEDEYQVTEDWLIDDTKKRAKNKRKLKQNTEESNSGDSDEEISDTNSDSRDKDSKSENSEDKMSPISKKRLISYDSPKKSDSNEFSSLVQAILNPDSNESNMTLKSDADLMPSSQNKMNSLDLIDRFLKKAKLNPLNCEQIEDDDLMSNIFDNNDIFAANDVTVSDGPIILHSTASSSTNLNQQKSSSIKSSKFKKQLKINKMDSFNLKAKSTEKKRHDSDDVIEDANDRLSERSSSIVSFKTITNEQTNNSSWKIKANIENRNFLIPINNLNATIDDLSKQIVARYKSLFSNEMGFREPLKVILKDNEGLILFGKDLIKDVLNDYCQVQLVVESWKDAPKVHELYEKNCLKEKPKIILNKSIQRELKLCETNAGLLNLSNYLINNYHMNIIMQSILSNNDYLKLIKSIDLSANILDDEFISSFFNIIEKFSNLKSLNLSNNQFTVKSLIYFSTVIKKQDDMNKKLVLEELNLSGNDFTTDSVNTNGLNILSDILDGLKLKSIDLCDCNFDFNNDTANMNSTFNNFFNIFKCNSQLSNLNLSYNRMSPSFTVNLFDVFSTNDFKNKIVSLNLDHCIVHTTKSIFDGLLKFVTNNQESLEYLNLSNFNLDKQQVRLLINYLCNCKCLKHLNLSYNHPTNEEIRLLLEYCKVLEKLSVITNSKSLIKYNDSLIECIEQKMLISNNCLKYFAFNFETNHEFDLIKNIFLQKLSNNLRIQFKKANVVELFV